MNIFVLDENIELCAQYHCDRHVVKMILESAQILCTALHKKGFDVPYKPTHPNHPCILWAEKSFANVKWLSTLALALNEEYRFRFETGRDHRSADVVRAIQKFSFPDIGLTEFVQIMPASYRIPDDAVSAYRAYYSTEKASFASWTNRPVPDWF